MKGTDQTNRLQKQIQNSNQLIIKNYESKHSASIKIQTVLGISQACSHQQPTLRVNHQPCTNATRHNVNKRRQCYPLLALNDEQILYYSCRYFVVYNLSSKEYQIINRDVRNCTLVQMKRFDLAQRDRKLIICVFQTQSTCENTFLALLNIKTDYESRTSRKDSRYDWRVLRIYTQPILIQDYCCYHKKNYLYFVTTKSSLQNEKSTQYLWVYDLFKQIMLINQQIRSNTVGFFINKLSLDDHNIIYLIGKNYFRQWTANFNQRSVKQSNVRNVQRVLKNKVLVDFQEIDHYVLKHQIQLENTLNLPDNIQQKNQILTQPSKLILILTDNQLLLVKNNQLISTVKPERNISKNAKNKDNIEKQLENSFNQIHKMKFLFDEYEQLKQREDLKRHSSPNHDAIFTSQQKDVKFSSISKCWKSQNQNYYFAIATNKFNVLVYEIVDFQIKLDTEYNYSKLMMGSTFKRIIPTQSGDILLIMSQNKEVHLINQENYELEDDVPIKSLWGNGQMHSGKICALTSPVIQNIMCSVGQDGTFKLWSLKKNQRLIMFGERPSIKPLGITIHPGGTMIAVNFERQIKLFSILPKEFYEITSIRTNYSSLQLKYSERGQFLVSNQGSVLIFYEPFSLKTLGYIEPVDLKCKIIDFRVSRNAQYVCFIAQDNSCYLQPIDIGQLSRWQHLQPSHHQIQPYTAFYFDFHQNQTQKGSFDQKRTKSLFIGATKNKYLVLYENLGQKLLAQFPVIDCYIVDIQVYESLLFVATSKGTVRVYNWPLLEEDLQLQVINVEQKQIRYKSPRYDEYQVWNQSIPIKKMHKLRFTNQIVVVNESGNMAILSFQQTKNRKIIYEEVSGERKKMQQLINQMFYIKRSEAQKRNKLIQKTQNDILKVQNQILRQKISLQRKMQDQESSVQKGFQVKNHMQQSQKTQYILKQQKQIQVLKQQINTKKSNLQQLKKFIIEDYQSKKIYEEQRNQNVDLQIKDIVLKHKDRIKRKMEQHKDDIKNKKRQYFLKVKQTQKEFEQQVLTSYERKVKEISWNKDQNNRDISTTQKEHSRQKGRGDKWIGSLLSDNPTSSCRILQTDNQNVLNLIQKLNKIQTRKLTHHNNTKSAQDLSFMPQFSIPSQKNIQQKTPATKLKRTGLYHINQRAYFKKKLKQETQTKQSQEDLKRINRNRLMQEEFNEEIIQEMTSKQNQDVLVQACRVEELQINNQSLQMQIQSLKRKVYHMESQDQTMQKDFQKYLEQYNLSRFQNLNLHSQVLKMQNQLIQRKQVLDNKQQIVMLAYQQKQKLQNYKQLVKGSLSKLQDKKQNIREVFFKKQNDLNIIFSQLVNQIHKMQSKRGALQKMQRRINLNEKQLNLKQLRLNQVIQKLKEIKKYLLLERMTDQNSQKSIHQYSEALMNTINFLKKRLFMESIKQKKNKQLKESNLDQILKQNKNLLEECNQLRSQGIQYENQIKNLSNKLKEANKMISIQSKLKTQKNQVNEQKDQLSVIKKLFKMHLNQFQQNDEQNISKDGQKGGSQVYYDSQKPKNTTKQNYNKVPSHSTNNFTLKDKDPSTQHKSFKLSGYIEAEPFQTIQL